MHFVAVTDRDEVAMLLTYGIPPVPGKEFDKIKASAGDSSTWRFPRQHGEYLVPALLAAWRAGEEFNEANQESPTAWMNRFAINRGAVARAIAGSREQVLVRKGRSVGLIDPEDSLAQRDRVLKLLRI